MGFHKKKHNGETVLNFNFSSRTLPYGCTDGRTCPKRQKICFRNILHISPYILLVHYILVASPLAPRRGFFFWGGGGNLP